MLKALKMNSRSKRPDPSVTNDNSGIDSSSISLAIAAMSGMAGPIALGVMTNHAHAGIVAALGGLALSGRSRGGTLGERVSDLLYAMTAGCLAMLTGSLLSGYSGPAVFGVAAVAALAALLGSISRPLARAGAQFTIFTIITANINTDNTEKVALLSMMLLFLSGATTTALLSLSLQPLMRRLCLFFPGGRLAEKPAPATRYTAQQLLGRWRRSLAHLTGWHYTLRLTLCLAVTQTLVWLQPDHHTYWMSLTVVLVVQRNLATALKRAGQRAAGTVVGVLLTTLLLTGPVPAWGMVCIIALFAAARTVLAEKNYTAYTAVMTPLIILLLDFGQPPSLVVIIDRLIATLTGCTVAFSLGYLGWSRITAANAGAVVKRPTQ